jgi:hypothetical protein
VVSDIGGIILLEIRIHISKLWSLQLSLAVAYPALGEKQCVEQIIVVDVERRAVELQSDETVVAHVDALRRRIVAVVVQDAVAIGDVRNGVAVAGGTLPRAERIRQEILNGIITIIEET